MLHQYCSSDHTAEQEGPTPSPPTVTAAGVPGQRYILNVGNGEQMGGLMEAVIPLPLAGRALLSLQQAPGLPHW